MNKIKNWFNRKLGMLAFAFGRTEKIIFSQSSNELKDTNKIYQSYYKGMLSDSLLKGEITLPVKELRWRLYKVLSESKNISSHITGYDNDGMPIVRSSFVNNYNLNKVLKDNYDPYEVELVIRNEPLTKSTIETFNSNSFDMPHSKKFNLVGQEMVDNSKTIGEISFDDMMSIFEDKKTIYIQRNLVPKFELEKYAKKLIVRKIDKTNKLLEFYISTYPDEYDRKSRLLLSEIKKIMNGYTSTITEFNKIGFITDKCIGAKDGLEYEYKIIKFDKVIKFNGYYVLKFLATKTINGDNIFEKYKLDELEKRYENKEPKN